MVFFSLKQMQSCLDAVKGAVILTFGAGNGPDKNEELMQVFKEASDRGVLMVNITQCLKGEVEAKYATGTVSLLDMHNIKTIIFFHILNVIIVYRHWKKLDYYLEQI